MADREIGRNISKEPELQLLTLTLSRRFENREIVSENGKVPDFFPEIGKGLRHRVRHFRRVETGLQALCNGDATRLKPGCSEAEFEVCLLDRSRVWPWAAAATWGFDQGGGLGQFSHWVWSRLALDLACYQDSVLCQGSC